MATTSLCECGRECKTAAVLLICDICGEQSSARGHYIPSHSTLELARRWRLDICRACVELLIARAPEEKRAELRRQAFGLEATVASILGGAS